MRPLEGFIPGKTSNPNNGAHGHWTVQARKRKTERARVLALTAPLRLTLQPILRITLTRFSRAVRMDPDGLAASLKSIQDGLAARLRIDDGSPLVEWEYRQEVGEPGVRYRIEHIAPVPAPRLPDPPPLPGFQWDAECHCGADPHLPPCPEARTR